METSKKTLINQLFASRRLSTKKEYETFENSLEMLQNNITIDDIDAVCQVFCDETKDDEVMFGLVHLIEQLQGNNYIKSIVIASPDMLEAHEWAMTLNKRIINSSKYFDEYINIINRLDSNHKEKILKLLIDIKNDNPRKFEEKVDLICKRTM